MSALRALQVLAGLLVVALALVDVAWTTIAAGSGGGPVTVRVGRQLWRTALRIHGRASGRWRGLVLTVAGVVVVFALLATWLFLVLAGWFAVFTAGEAAVADSTTGRPGDLVDRLYFTGYTVFTLGNGDLRPGAGGWQLATVAATGTGLILVTLSITYLVPVAAAVSERRQLAGTIAALGGSPAEIVCRSWTGEGFGSLPQHLVTLVPLVQRARQLHLTYPVVHYFHSVERSDAAAPNLTALDDALLLLADGVDPSVRPDPASLVPLRRSMGAFLETVLMVEVAPDGATLPPPERGPLREAGIPLVDDERWDAAIARDADRRRLLRGFLTDDGWISSG